MIKPSYHLTVVVLAAGKSERFEDIKVLTPLLENGPIMITKVLSQLSKALTNLNISKSNLHIATGIYHKEISACLLNQYSLIHCSEAILGMGHTIAQSTAAFCHESSHIMFALADQIALSTQDYCKIIQQSMNQPHKLICATTQGKLMPPAIFPQQYFAQLQKLSGDKGAKVILNQSGKNLTTIELPNAAIDIDTKAALLDWQKR